MIKRFPLFAAAALLAGCNNLPSRMPSWIPFIGKKHQVTTTAFPKPTPLIATDTETEFRHRWVEKRSGELVSQGMTASAAQLQATAEFKVKFAATQVAKH